MVQSNNAQVTGGEGIVAMITSALDYAAEVVSEAAQEQADLQHRRLKATAQANPRWESLSNDLEMWPEDDGYSYGLPADHPRHDEAMKAEYGDESHPPAPLLRMGTITGARDAGWSMQEAFTKAGF